MAEAVVGSSARAMPSMSIIGRVAVPSSSWEARASRSPSDQRSPLSARGAGAAGGGCIGGCMPGLCGVGGRERQRRAGRQGRGRRDIAALAGGQRRELLQRAQLVVEGRAHGFRALARGDGQALRLGRNRSCSCSCAARWRVTSSEAPDTFERMSSRRAWSARRPARASARTRPPRPASGRRSARARRA